MTSDDFSFNTLIRVCEKGDLPERALELLEAMQRQGMAPDLVTFSNFVKAQPSQDLFEAL